MPPSNGLARIHVPKVPVRVLSGSSNDPPPGARAPVKVPSILLLRASHSQHGRNETAKPAVLIAADLSNPICLRFIKIEAAVNATAKTGPT